MKHFEVALTKSTKFTRTVSKMPFKLHVGIGSRQSRRVNTGYFVYDTDV